VIADYRFRVRSHNKDLVEQTTRAFVTNPDQDTNFDLIDLDSPNHFTGESVVTDQPLTAIKRVITTAQSRYQQKLFFDGCCLLTSLNQLVFLVGHSFSGKSTLSVALALGLGWKIVSEDLVFIDQDQDRIIPFICPLSMRPTAPDLIEAAVGVRPAPIRFGRWLVRYDIFSECQTSPKFLLSACLQQTGTGQPLSAEPCSPDDFARRLITHGNWLTKPDAPDYVWKCMRESSSWILSGGSVKDRVEWLQHMSVSLPSVST
jgi:hypothetical protein